MRPALQQARRETLNPNYTGTPHGGAITVHNYSHYGDKRSDLNTEIPQPRDIKLPAPTAWGFLISG